MPARLNRSVRRGWVHESRRQQLAFRHPRTANGLYLARRAHRRDAHLGHDKRQCWAKSSWNSRPSRTTSGRSGAAGRKHLGNHGNDAQRSLTSIECDKLDSRGLEGCDRPGSPDEPGTPRRLRARAGSRGEGVADVPRSTRATAGFAFCGLMPAAGWAKSLSPATRSCAARSRSSRSRTSYADDPESRARFLLEAEITGGLEHPGIVPVYGLGHYADGRPFYAMRFIRGDSLKEAIERFHSRQTTRARPGRARAGVAAAAPPVHRRLQRGGLRPQPRRPAPRPQAGQHHAGPVRRDAGRRLGPGQADRPSPRAWAPGRRSRRSGPTSASGARRRQVGLQPSARRST